MIVKKYTVENLVKEISKLQMEEFIGVCKILGVELVEEDGTPKDAVGIFEEVINKLDELNRRKRKNLMKLLRAANEDR